MSMSGIGISHSHGECAKLHMLVGHITFKKNRNPDNVSNIYIYRNGKWAQKSLFSAPA